MPNSLTDLDTYSKALEGLGIATGITGDTKGASRPSHIASSFVQGGQNALSGSLVGLNEFGSDVTGLLGMEGLQAKYDLLAAQRRGEISLNSAIGAIGEELGYGSGIGSGISVVGKGLAKGANRLGDAWKKSTQIPAGSVDEARRMINQGAALATISPKAAISAFGKGTNDALTLGVGNTGMADLLQGVVGGTSRAANNIASTRMARVKKIAGEDTAQIAADVAKARFIDEPVSAFARRGKIGSKLANKEVKGLRGFKDLVQQASPELLRQVR